ncbi:Co-chaperone protein DjlA [Candidatus Profftia lariciata]|uniref:co-chaperone DjlA n=1 Tax=Candidatus Profftia lariciata TaxID=1987921 RepID=UPI001D00A68C|nr:co-chaperone DjlA [Candidatus Profftia lariciata]UDG81346.1 Co-chaperone protein DjlA [Candidatus Profftia lariciata]
MQCWGKIIGALIGLISGTGFFGILIGIFVGSIFDKSYYIRHSDFLSTQSQRQNIFFSTTFQVMGHLTKSKGRVTEADIYVANSLMESMQLYGHARISAQQAFREGKKANFMLRETIRVLRSNCCNSIDLIRMFLEIQLQAAFSDGLLHPNERTILYVIAEELGFSRVQFDQFISMMEGVRQFDERQEQHKSFENQYNRSPTLADAYKVLGLQSHDTFITVKRAYRKLMNQHHPDKLVAKGLPKEMIEMAKQKVQEIQSAYDFIKKERKFK